VLICIFICARSRPFQALDIKNYLVSKPLCPWRSRLPTSPFLRKIRVANCFLIGEAAFVSGSVEADEDESNVPCTAYLLRFG
jgi:hypothetical protein